MQSLFLVDNTSCIYHLLWHKYFHGSYFSIDTIQRLGRWKDCRVTYLFYDTQIWHWSVPTSLSHSTRFNTREVNKIESNIFVTFYRNVVWINRISSSYLFCSRFKYYIPCWKYISPFLVICDTPLLHSTAPDSSVTRSILYLIYYCSSCLEKFYVSINFPVTVLHEFLTAKRSPVNVINKKICLVLWERFLWNTIVDRHVTLILSLCDIFCFLISIQFIGLYLMRYIFIIYLM